MADIKTKPTDIDVNQYLETLAPSKKEDARILISMMQDITQEKPVMWGPSMIGFGHAHLTYASGREVDFFQLGFAARKNALTIYLSIEVNRKVFDRLGKHTKGVGCLYVQKLSDIDLDELRIILEESFETIKKYA